RRPPSIAAGRWTSPRPDPSRRPDAPEHGPGRERLARPTAPDRRAVTPIGGPLRALAGHVGEQPQPTVGMHPAGPQDNAVAACCRWIEGDPGEHRHHLAAPHGQQLAHQAEAPFPDLAVARDPVEPGGTKGALVERIGNLVAEPRIGVPEL